MVPAEAGRTAPTSWRESAACLGKTDLFFPPKPGANGAYDAARLICRSCPVLEDCRHWVTVEPLPAGFAAGMPAKERDMIRWGSRSAS